MRRVALVVGEVMITFGFVCLLFVAWQLWFDPLVQARAQAAVVAQVERDFLVPIRAKTQQAEPAPHAAGAAPATRAIGILRIPRLGGPDWAKPVYEGVSPALLAQGIGHYPASKPPGEVGNVALAGHRSGHGNPLIDLDSIQRGDVIVLENRQAFFVYRAVSHEIVHPNRVDLVSPVPRRPGTKPTPGDPRSKSTERLLTITTCNPRFGNTERYVVHAVLDKTVPREQGMPADLLLSPNAA